ncbi:YihY/virulence factor BrkB family protein [Brachybacterium massiliense]|uniref:YihY/virulence factor BrkB family protein n=1 Tax=Brachybacterium massiliense TaxID=1755098 RepID=UPI000B3BB6C6|nr:YihY/virulence factor BrkB family protein [Brachybacterium massiliense]
MAEPRSKDDDAPSMSGTTLKYMAKRVLTEFLRDGGTDQAAKLTYFMVLSIAPTLLALFSLATLLLSDLKDEIAQLITEAIESAASGSELGAGDAVKSTIDSLMGSAAGGTVALIIGIATALWSASAYIKAYGRVANHIYEVPEGRGPVRMNATMLALTVAMILGILLVMVSMLLNETIVESLLGPIASTIGAEGVLEFLMSSFLPIWAWVKWPVILVIAFALISLLYWGAPNVDKPFRFISPGGVFAILGIGVAAVALSIYMGTVAGYSSYGAIGGIMAVLFALWVMNIVIIMGAEVDAEYQRARELASGKPAEESLTLPMRDTSAAEKAEAKHEKIVDEGRDIRLQNLHHDSEAYTGESARLTPRHGVPSVDPDEAEAPSKDS